MTSVSQCISCIKDSDQCCFFNKPKKKTVNFHNPKSWKKWIIITVDLWQRFVYAQTPDLHYHFISSFPISSPPAALDSAASKWMQAFLSIINR